MEAPGRRAGLAGDGRLHAVFTAVMYVFGAVLLWTAVTMLRGGHRLQPGSNGVLRAARRILPASGELHGQRFVIRHGGRLLATPLLLALMVVEASDVIFAVDSIPAVLAVTTDTFVVYTSNVFALLGMRALYFLLAGAAARFRYLQPGLAAILAAVGVKLLISDVCKLPAWASPAFDGCHGVTPDRFRPATPARIRPIDSSLAADTASPRKIMPAAAAPAAPIPVQTAYAGPTSSSRSATVSRPKLISAQAAKAAVGSGCVSPWLSFRNTAKPVSNRPAATRITHAITTPRIPRPRCSAAAGRPDVRRLQTRWRNCAVAGTVAPPSVRMNFLPNERWCVLRASLSELPRAAAAVTGMFHARPARGCGARLMPHLHAATM